MVTPCRAGPLILTRSQRRIGINAINHIAARDIEIPLANRAPLRHRPALICSPVWTLLPSISCSECPGSSGVEQRIENPRVGGSIPPPGTTFQPNQPPQSSINAATASATTNDASVAANTGTSGFGPASSSNANRERIAAVVTASKSSVGDRIRPFSRTGRDLFGSSRRERYSGAGGWTYQGVGFSHDDSSSWTRFRIAGRRSISLSRRLTL